jgi:DNA replication protein DnaC
MAERLLADARIPRRYQHCTLDNYTAYNEQLAKAQEHAARLAEGFPVVDRGLFLLGPPGVGKTHLAVAVLRQVIATRGARGIFYDTRDLLRVIRSTYDQVNQMAEMDVLKPVMEADMLVLDDLGAEKTSEWVEETMNLIVNTRYNERRPTIFTTNYENLPDEADLDTLKVRVGFRLHSRLHEMCEFLEYDGGDFRMMPANGGADDLATLWKKSRGRKALPARTHGQARAQLREPKELKWPGGKAGRG